VVQCVFRGPIGQPRMFKEIFKGENVVLVRVRVRHAAGIIKVKGRGYGLF